MPLISRSALVPYNTEEMYKLVAAIEDYPKFLPWCRSTQVLSRTDEEVQASIEIARGALNKRFTTRNRMHRNKMIEMHLLQGPFKHLQGLWRFDELKTPTACKISFDLDFEFENKLVAMVAGPIFNQIANSMVEAFSKRAIEVYGERSI